MLTINLYADPNYTVMITLDEKQYRFSFRWIAVEEAWYLYIKGISDPTVEYNGIKLVGGVDLLEPYGILDLGQLWLIDLSEQNRDPGFDNIATDFVLYYE